MYEAGFEIPDVLNGCRTETEWRKRRAEILGFFAENVYGRRPRVDCQVTWKELVREQVEELHAIHIRTELTVTTDIGIYAFPVSGFVPIREERVPATVLICSQSKNPGPMAMPPGMEGKTTQELMEMVGQMFQQFGIVMENPAAMASMMPGGGEGQMPAPVPLDMDKDYDNGHWPVREMMKQGMAVFGFYATDAETDNAAEFPAKLAAIFGTTQQRKENEWGVLAVWAFAARCVRDYVDALAEIDSRKIAVTGHSRCGKAALWCGANDEQFAAVMPNGSGCCGAALSKGKTGENLASIQAFFPHWFAPNFRRYAGNEGSLPFDQHCLLAAVAPRLLHVGSGSADDWADPQGEHYSTVLASEAWKLYGAEDFPQEMPDENECVIAGKVGYHLRKGPHKLDTYDWACRREHMENLKKK